MRYITKTACILLNNYCNFGCPFCGFRRKSVRKRKSISLHIAEKFLQKLKEENYQKVSISGGGEPFLSLNKTIKLISLARKCNFNNIELVSNGSYIFYPNAEKLIKKLKEIGLRRLYLSIDYDHSLFISYHKLIKAIKIALENDLRIAIKSVTKRKPNTYHKNLNLIKHIAKDLKGMLIRFPSLNNNNNFVILFRPIGGVINYISGTMPFAVDTPSPEDLRHRYYSSFGNPKKNIGEIIFECCNIPTASVIDFDGNIFPCFSFHSLNNPKLYSAKFTNEKYKKLEDCFDPFLKKIIRDRLFFIKTYLKMKKDKKMKKLLEKTSFYNRCDLCMWLLLHKEEIENLPNISTTNLVIFLFLHLPSLIRMYVKDYVDLFYRTSYLMVYYIPNLLARL
jgi:MoaA/NifB/PqqE/SkfB family radical SAM enzyme